MVIHKQIFTKKNILIIFFIFILSVFIVRMVQHYVKQTVEYYFSGSVMGCIYHVRYVTTHNQKNQQIVFEAVDRALHKVDQSMSTYKANSELMQLNRWAVNKPFHISLDLANVLKTSFSLSAISNGAYDVTVGSLVNLWGFGPASPNSSIPSFIDWKEKQHPPKLPTQDMINKAKQKIGYQYVDLDMQKLTVTKTRDVFIDLSSIAKGYGVDKAVQAMEKLGIRNFLIEVGGEIYAKGEKKTGRPWITAIRSPHRNDKNPLIKLSLKNQALATSGDYLNFYNVNHHRYNHEINPITGAPEENNIASITVIAKSTMLADAYSTMLMVIDANKRERMIKTENLAVFIVYRKQSYHHNKFETYMSEQFKKHLKKV